MFVSSKLHIICGRAGYEFEDYKDDNGKRQIEKVGTKMKTEGETGFEPSLLVLMEQVEDLRTGKVEHRATVQKGSRSRTFAPARSSIGRPLKRTARRFSTGEQIDNPDFKDFLPHIERLNLGGDHIGVDINGDSQHILQTEKRDWQPVQCKIALGEMEEILVRHYPGQTAADKKAKAELLRTHFKACWAEIESIMPLDRLRSGYDTLHITLEGTHSLLKACPSPGRPRGGGRRGRGRRNSPPWTYRLRPQRSPPRLARVDLLSTRRARGRWAWR
jgi:hypothetical protein